ncbi:FG-GAP repeat protein [Winogradskyella schleiferi]|uniref:FG-GAP repeat protein n=1 Tax=Winogradskyella schleiferi TaxID=2686078 RepID=UPI0015BAD1E4|nr:FG-GAP repeat protein [Winogradskyella schleiferi]
MNVQNLRAVLLLLLFSYAISAQVGIGTTNPEGALDIVSSNSGLVLPRVTNIENVTDTQGNPAINGTVVYDTSRDKICFRINGKWLCLGDNGTGTASMEFEKLPPSNYSAYIKASNTNNSDQFGKSVAISGDGLRIAVGASGEDSNATGINGNQTDNSASIAGAVYVFVNNSGTWTQEAYIKASNTDANDRFGSDVSLNYDGSILAVSATGERSNATGVNGDQSNNSAGSNTGAVYIFENNGSWSQIAYVKASNTEAGDLFGRSIAISDDGSYLVVSATGEESNATGVNGDETNNSSTGSGAVYIFENNSGTWSQQAYIKASNTDNFDEFGGSIDINADGSTLVVGARGESSLSTGINSNQTDNSASRPGAVYVFERSGTTWSQTTYIKPSVIDANDQFGWTVSISNDGNLIAVGLWGEDSSATGINGDNTNNSVTNAGAVYIFEKYSGNWIEEAYIKASFTESNDLFGRVVSLSGNGKRLLVTVSSEDSSATGFNGNQSNNSRSNSGAVYAFKRNNGVWTEEAYIKNIVTDFSDEFGASIAIANDGCNIVASVFSEDSNATGVGGDFNDNSSANSGAVMVID